MSERKLNKEQEATLQKIIQEWKDEVECFFETHKDDENTVNRLDGPQTWGLASIQQKYKKKANKELGMEYFTDVTEVKKASHKKFSDLIARNPHGFPELPKS